MSKTVENITFIFENLEHATFNPDDIGYFSLADIHQEICRVALNEIQKINIAGIVAVELNSNAKGKLFLPNGENEDASALSRLYKFDDITAIEVTYEDGSSELYYVKYENNINESFPWNNVYQRSALLNSGNYAIVIGKDKKISDFFKDVGSKE